MADNDPLLDMLLAERGCPFKAGTRDSVVWMLGFKAALERAKLMVEAAAYAPPPTIDSPRAN